MTQAHHVGRDGGPLVIGYDGSEDAANAIAVAARLLAPRRALVVHSFVGLSRMLLRSNPPGLTGPIAEAAKKVDSADAEEAERLAAEGAQLAIAAGFEAQPIVVEQDGRPAQTIIALAKKHEATAIVAGARGRSAFAAALLGSVSNGLVHHSPMPVLVVPAQADPEASSGPPLLCYDASPESQHAIETAGGLLTSKAGFVLHLWQSWIAQRPAYVPFDGGAVAGMTRELDDIALAQSGELAEQGTGLAIEAGFDPTTVSSQCDGTLWRGVLDAAEQHEASVIVLGTGGRSALSAVLGSVSHGVVHHARRPVLVVPANAHEQRSEEGERVVAASVG